MNLIKNVIKKFFPDKYHYDMQMLRLFFKKDDIFYEIAHRREFLRKAFRMLSINGITGNYLEFGCCSGNTFRLAYHESRSFNFNCKLWAFDSFQGLPKPTGEDDKHPFWKEGKMAISQDDFKAVCEQNKIPASAYNIVPGFYQDTLVKESSYKGDLPKDVALAYIDCDMYSSTKSVLNFLSSRLKQGMVIAFDDYYCYSSENISGERRAHLEFIKQNPDFNFLPYLQFGWHGMSFVVEDKLYGNGLI